MSTPGADLNAVLASRGARTLQVPGASSGGPDGFGAALVDAVQSLDRLQREADASGLQLGAGEPVDLHDVMLAQDRASLSLQLALQVRNKLVEAYQDVMRMQL